MIAAGTPSSTLKGSFQLSYCAARIKNTKTNAAPNTAPPDPSAAFSWYDMLLQAIPSSFGSVAATSSSAPSASAELYPSAGAPEISAARNILNRLVYEGPAISETRANVFKGMISPDLLRT